MSNKEDFLNNGTKILKVFFGNLWYGADAFSSFRKEYDVAGTDVMRTSPVIRLYVWLAGPWFCQTILMFYVLDEHKG